MNKDFEALLSRVNSQTVELFHVLEAILHDTIPGLEERVWAKMPLYCLNGRKIILAPFNGHINIISNPWINHREEYFPNVINLNRHRLTDYSITPKGMLQIFCHQPFDPELLKEIFKENFA